MMKLVQGDLSREGQVWRDISVSLWVMWNSSYLRHTQLEMSPSPVSRRDFSFPPDAKILFYISSPFQAINTYCLALQPGSLGFILLTSL